MAHQQSRERLFALMIICSIAAGPSFAVDGAQPSSGHPTSDASRGWSLRNSGMDGIDAREVAVHAANPNLMYAASSRGVFKTTNAGLEWTLSDDGSVTLGIAIDPRNPSVVYASTATEAKKTADGGVTWTEIRPNPARLSGAVALAIDPSNPSTVYAVLVENGLSKSINAGETFSYINNGLPVLRYMDWSDVGVSALAIDPSKTSTLLAGSIETLKSVNGGMSWNQTEPGLHVRWPHAFAFDPAQSDLVYAGTGQGLYRSSDGGGRWQLLENEFSSEWVTDVVVDPSDGRNVYVSIQGENSIYRSSDRGETWTVFNQGLPPVVRVESLAIDATGTFLAAATSRGVFIWSAGDGITLPPSFHAERLQSDRTRLPRLLEQVRALNGEASPAPDDSTLGLLFAVAGNAAGANGTYFRSDVTLMSSDAAPQDVIAVWLAAGSDGTDAPSLRLTLGPSAVTVTDFIGKIGFSGVGSLLLIGIDSEMNVDADANLTGFSRIWTAGPEGVGSVSQSLPAARLTSVSQKNPVAAAIGLRMDAEYRTNVGIVNLDVRPQDFTVTARGERKSATFTIAVEPFSMRQVSLPAGDYGDLTVIFRTTGSDLSWVAFASSVDNATGDGWASQAVVVDPQDARP